MTPVDRNVMSLAWWQVRRSPKVWIALLVSLAPLVAGVISIVGDGVNESRQSSAVADDEVDGFQMGFQDLWVFAVVYTALPLAALLLAGGLVADEVEDRTLSYLLVRPIPRVKLYLSKLLPVVLATAALGAIQTVALGLMRLISWAFYGIGDREVKEASSEAIREFISSGTPLPTVDTGVALVLAILGASIGAALLGGALAALFGFVSLCTTRFHFIANLLVLFAFEFPFSQLGGLGIGFLTATYHALSIAGAFDITNAGSLVADEAPVWLAIPAILAITAGWAWLGRWRMKNRDFNVTSAAT